MFISRPTTNTKPLPRQPRLQTVVVKSKRFGHFPKSFMWRGKLHQVEAVERCWTVKRDRDKTSLYCFRVRTPSGTYILQQDLLKQKWYLRKK